MSNLDAKITWLTIGIKFKRTFRMTDISGEIVDHILSHEKSPFSEKFFPKIDTNKWERVLHNDDTGEYLRINTDDLILCVKVNDDFENKFDWLSTNVINYFKNNLFEKFKIKNIRRFGVIFTQEISPNDKFRNSIAALTENEVVNPNQITISFSKKDVSKEGLLVKGIDDYKNRIYTLQEDNGIVNASLDCQYYYNPIIEDFRDCFAEDILVDSKNYLHNSFHTWLIKYAKEL